MTLCGYQTYKNIIMKIKKAFIHIGQHKTGTTSLQKYFKANSVIKDLYCPINFSSKYEKAVDHAPLAWFLMGDDRINNFNYNLNDFKKEISKKKKIFLSAEDFSLLLTNTECKKKFERLFKNYQIIYICYIRNTNDKNISLIKQLTSFKSINKFLRKLIQIKLFFNLKKFGQIPHGSNYFHKSLHKFYFYTDYYKFKKNITFKSKGKFYFFSYDEKTNIINEFYKLGFLKKNRKQRKYNVTEKKFLSYFLFYNFFLTNIVKKSVIQDKKNYLKIKKLILK